MANIRRFVTHVLTLLSIICFIVIIYLILPEKISMGRVWSMMVLEAFLVSCSIYLSLQIEEEKRPDGLTIEETRPPSTTPAREERRPDDLIIEEPQPDATPRGEGIV